LSFLYIGAIARIDDHPAARALRGSTQDRRKPASSGDLLFGMCESAFLQLLRIDMADKTLRFCSALDTRLKYPAAVGLHKLAMSKPRTRELIGVRELALRGSVMDLIHCSLKNTE
jgi:hypothetical protein